MVGQQTLTLLIGVRVPVSQPLPTSCSTFLRVHVPCTIEKAEQTSMTSSEQHVLQTALAAFRRETGVTAKLQYSGKSVKVEVCFARQVPNQKLRFLVDVKTVDRLEIPAAVRAKSAPGAIPRLLVAPFITRESAARCRQIHQPFIDTAGNVFLEAAGLFISVAGMPRPTGLKPQQWKAETAAGLQVTFAIASHPSLLRATHREIAAQAKVALGSVGPALRDLEARGLISLAPPRRILNPRLLVQGWAASFPRRLLTKLEPQRFEADPAKLAKANLAAYGAYWGGEIAAQRMTRYLKPAAFVIYASEPIKQLVIDQRLKANPHGNLEIRRIFWDFPRTSEFPDLAPPLLVYADLMASGDGRNQEAAEIIYERWMQPSPTRTSATS